MEVLIIVVMLTGWLTLFFAAGCVLEAAARVLKEKVTSAKNANVCPEK